MQRALLPQRMISGKSLIIKDGCVQTASNGFSDDWFLDGRLLLRQPRRGHRIGTDALLLAAATPTNGRICDLGSGVGGVGLALALGGAKSVVLVERDAVFADCAQTNIDQGQFRSDVQLAVVDLFDRKAFLENPLLADQSFDAVATNPPFDQSLRGRRTPNDLKRAAHAMQGGTLEDWLKVAVRLLRDGGLLTLIHRADKLGEVLAAMPKRAGGVVVRPVQPKTNEPATRILVAATAGSRAPLSLLPPLILHGEDGEFLPDARRIHEGRASISMTVNRAQ